MKIREPEFECLTVDNLEAYFANQECKRAARKAIIVERLGGMIMGAELQNRRDINGEEFVMYACITPSFMNGKVRVTMYDKNGLSGDSTFNNADEALDEYLSSGYTEIADISFDALALSDSFQQGNERLAAMHRSMTYGADNGSQALS